MSVPLHDKLAGAAVLVLLVGVLVLAGLGRPVPEYLVDAFKVAIGFALRSGVAVANDYRHRQQPG